MVRTSHRCTFTVRRGVDATTPAAVRTPESSPPAVAPVHDRHCVGSRVNGGNETRGGPGAAPYFLYSSARARPPARGFGRPRAGARGAARLPRRRRRRCGRWCSPAGRGSARRRCGRPGIDARARARRARARRRGRAAPRRGCSFAALIDLFDGVDVGALAGLPAPQRAALEVALLRAEPAGAPPEPHAIALGLLNALRALAAPRAAAGRDRRRRSGSTAVGRRARVRRAPARGRAGRRSCSPGAPAAVRARAGARARAAGAPRGRPAEPRRDAPPAVRAARAEPAAAAAAPDRRRDAGQPAVRARGRPRAGRARAARDRARTSRCPDAVEDLLGTRVARLPDPVRRLLLAVALSGDLRTDELAAIAERGRGRGRRRRRAAASSTATACARRTRCSPPRRRQRSRPRERRELHRALAGVVADDGAARPAPRARDRPPRRRRSPPRSPPPPPAPPRAAPRPEAVAAGRARAAADAGRTRPERSERLLDARRLPARRRASAQRVTDLLTPELDVAAAGRAARPRAGCCCREGGAHRRPTTTSSAHLERALAESRRRSRAARARARDAWRSTPPPRASSGSPRPRRGRSRRCRRRRAPDRDVERLALRALGWARSLRGRPIDDLCERFARRERRRVPHRRLARARRRPAARLARRARARRARC